MKCCSLKFWTAAIRRTDRGRITADEPEELDKTFAAWRIVKLIRSDGRAGVVRIRVVIAVPNGPAAGLTPRHSRNRTAVTGTG